jgi:hemerythrin
METPATKPYTFSPTGFEKIDAHHAKIGHLLRKAGRALDAHLENPTSASESLIRNILTMILMFVDMHFFMEERLMGETHYPLEFRHTMGHDMIREELNQLQGQLLVERVNAVWLKKIMIDLIPSLLKSEDDRALSEFLNQRGKDVRA